jgi:hypothetical protein
MVMRIFRLSNKYCKLGANPLVPNNQGLTPIDLRMNGNNILTEAAIHRAVMDSSAGGTALGKFPLQRAGDMLY